jgi:hypothetical protein
MVTVVPSLSISPDKVCFFILKAREFEAKDVVTDPGDASNATDDGMRSVLEDHSDDPTQQELRAFINTLTEDEQVDLVALMWLGRGDGAPAQQPHGSISSRQAAPRRSPRRGALAPRPTLPGLIARQRGPPP